MHSSTCSEPVDVPVTRARLEGELEWPLSPAGLVLFAEARRSRSSPDLRALATVLHDAQIATLIVDFLVLHEDSIDPATGLRGDIALLANRLVELIDWTRDVAHIRRLPIGLFAAGAGAAAALVAAGRRRDVVRAVVSRGGRPDLAKDYFRDVRAPTLLIVGQRDHEGLQLNADAARALGRTARLESIEGAAHLAGESEAVLEVARLATDWFALHFAAGREAVHAPPR